MKTSLKLIGMAALVLTACSKEEEASLMAPPASPAPVVAVDVTAGVSLPPPPNMSVMATPANPSPTPQAVAPANTGSATDVGTEHMTPEQRLTYALQLFYDDPNAPAIHSFEPLVERRLIASVPVAPAGKKYVIDMSRIEVHLVDASE